MPNLYIFDKDHTLVYPRKDGYVGHPEDQVLYEGVRAKLDRLRSNGHALAIASNQGGCDWHTIEAGRLVIGSKFRPPTHYENFTVTSIGSSPVTDKDLLIKVVNHDDDDREYDMIYDLNETVLVQHKTIESGIAEMQFAADLCGIREAYFAPTMDGKSIVSLNRSDSKWHHQIEAPSPESNYSFGGFRKPQPGMLLMPSYGYKFDRRIMIGDRDSDREAAVAAGFEFMWAEDWRNE